MFENRQFLFIFPLFIFSILLIFLWKGLSLDPHKLPSALLNKTVPPFELSTVQNSQQIFTEQDLHGKIALFNVWATWCESCREEHSVLMDIEHDYQIPIYGLDYKDQRLSALQWLHKFGNPYKLVGFDCNGSVAIDWGVYGTPETFVIDKNGFIRYKVIGPLTEEDWQEKVLPVIRGFAAPALLRINHENAEK